MNQAIGEPQPIDEPLQHRVYVEDIEENSNHEHHFNNDNDPIEDDHILNFEVNDVNGIEDYIFKVAASLYGATNLNIKHAMEIMNMMKEFSTMTIKFCKDSISTCGSI